MTDDASSIPSSSGSDAVAAPDTPSLPTPRDWTVRHSGYPWVNGPLEEQVVRTRAALLAIRSSDGASSTEITTEHGDVHTVGWYARQLTSSGLISSNGRGRFRVSDDAQRWLESNDDRILTGILHARILLFGEILLLLQSEPDLTHEELRDLANAQYNTSWKTLDPIRKRVGWLRSLGLVSFSFNNTLTLTTDGISTLALLEVVHPEDIVRSAPSATPKSVALPSLISELLSGLDTDTLSGRKIAFGYIPRSGSKTIYEDLRQLCSWFDPSLTKDAFLEKAATDFDVKESSGTSSLYTLVAFGLIERASMTEYQLTAFGRTWIDSEQELALAAIIHANVRIVGELVNHLQEVTKVPALRKTINDAYGVELGLQGIRSRVNLLLACGVVEQLAPGRFRATPTGLAFAESIPLQDELSDHASSATPVPQGEEEHRDGASSLIAELVQASTDSQHPNRFEIAAQQAFEFLGYRAEHLGGPGKTDVLVHYSDAPGADRRFVVDTKASAAGPVTDNMVQFPAINDHTKKHKADFAVVVASEYSGRITNWAPENNVLLVNIAELSEILRRQSSTPAPLAKITAYFAGKENGWESLQSEWRDRDNSTNLLTEVVDCLRREYDNPDDETGGALTVEQVYFLLRNAVEPRPTQATIKPLLDFLVSPLVRGAHAEGKGWLMPDPPSQIARRLRDIANRIDAVNEDIPG